MGQIKQIFSHYGEQGAQQRKLAYESLKEQFDAKLKQAVDKQLGLKDGEELGISVESLPQFQEEWQRVSAQLDEQYLKLLTEFKHELERTK